MKTEKITVDLVPAFKEYYFQYAKEQDESFPPGDEYAPGGDEPAYLLIDEQGKPAGAAVLMMHKPYAEAKTGRFRIFHCSQQNTAYYRMLTDEILKHTSGLDDIYCFVTESRHDIREAWEKTGFRIKRYSWILKRSTQDFTASEFPAGYELKTFRAGIDEEAWCSIINESFANMLGHVHLYPEKIAEWRKDPSYLNDGMKLLWHNDKPVGTIAMIKEIENGNEVIFIEGVGLLNSSQGFGLGKNLIRAGIEYAGNYGTEHVMLSVNGENDRAAELYLKEGFIKVALYICYSLNLK